MVIDSSALVAVLFRDSGYFELKSKMLNADIVLIGAPIVFETAMVLERESSSVDGLSDFLLAIKAEVVPFEERHSRAALIAFRRFGKGRHPARLNILDCMSYAVAEIAGLPLLYVGDDFAKTDIEAA